MSRIRTHKTQMNIDNVTVSRWFYPNGVYSIIAGTPVLLITLLLLLILPPPPEGLLVACNGLL